MTSCQMTKRIRSVAIALFLGVAAVGLTISSGQADDIRIGVVPCITDCGSNMGSTLVGNVSQTAAEGTLTGTDTDVTTDLVDSIVLS